MTATVRTALKRVLAAVCAAFLVFGGVACQSGSGSGTPSEQDGGGY